LTGEARDVKSDRLLSLLLLLQAHGQLSAADLAKRLEVSTRTVMRDVDALSAVGVPVFTERGRYGGIALLPGYRTDVTGLTAPESRALFVLLSGSAYAELGLGKAISSALRKVMAALPAPHRVDADLASRRILIDPVRWRAGPAPSPSVDLGVLQEAIFTDRGLAIRYRPGDDGRLRSYALDPYGLVDKAGVWYLVADHRGEAKLFRVDRMASATVTDEPVQRRAGVELADLWDVLRRRIDEIPTPIEVTVSVRRQILGRFLRVHAPDLAPLADRMPAEPDRDDPPERVRIDMRFRSLGAAEALLAFGIDAEVVTPDELRVALARKAIEAAALYGSDRR